MMKCLFVCVSRKMITSYPPARPSGNDVADDDDDYSLDDNDADGDHDDDLCA